MSGFVSCSVRARLAVGVMIAVLGTATAAARASEPEDAKRAAGAGERAHSTPAAPASSPTRAPYAATSHRTFEDVAAWTAVFDDPARDVWQKPRELVAALEIRPGTTVADLGAGTGYFSRYLSAAVGADGSVLAVDTEPNLVARLRERAEKEKTPNVTPILASFDNPRLPAGTVDLVLIVDTFHHIDARLEYLQRLRRVLKPGGRVAVVDWQAYDIPVGPEPDHKLSRDQVVAEMQAAGYRLVGEPAVLPYQYTLVFTTR